MSNLLLTTFTQHNVKSNLQLFKNILFVRNLVKIQYDFILKFQEVT